MNAIQRIEDFINGELQVIADELKEEIIDAQYEDMMYDLAQQEVQSNLFYMSMGYDYMDD